jgi:glycosyltransferase involved in cell wall biosynthesis
MGNMKIGIDCHNLEGQRTGVGRYLWNLLREWENVTGSDPVTNGVRPRPIEFFLYFKNEIPEDVRSLTPHMRNLHGKSNAIFKHWLLPRAAMRDKVDVLFCPDYSLPFLLDPRIKKAVTIHDIIYEARPQEYTSPSWKDKILLKWASKQSAKKADVIFAPSEFTKSEIVKYYKVNPEKVVVTPLAPDSIFRPYTHDREDKYIFFVGTIFNRRFLPQKIEAFAEFAKSRPDFAFLIVGRNHTRPYQDIGALVGEANRRLGTEAVVWREHVNDEELVRLYSGAFATLWCSSYEGFGLPMLESMACGTPVITSPMGSLPEIAGDAAMYVERPENPEEISNALAHLVRYGSYRDELIAKGLARAKTFSWQKCAQETLDKILNLNYTGRTRSA